MQDNICQITVDKTLSLCKNAAMNLKEYRIKNGLSVIALAKKLGCTRQHVYEIESDTPHISPKFAKFIQKKTNSEVTAKELLGID
jgi:transcriptional regulator with XRE-family HTH domain